MWNDIWRQRQESETSVWRTHLTSTSLFAAHSSKPFTYIITDADLCKHTRKRFSVNYKNTISYSCVDSGTILLPNANNIQQGHFLEQQWRTMASLSRLRLTWYSLLVHWSKMTPNAGHPIRTILSKHIFHCKQSTVYTVRPKLKLPIKMCESPSQKPKDVFQNSSASTTHWNFTLGTGLSG